MRKLILSAFAGLLAVGFLAVAPSVASAHDHHYPRRVVVVPTVRAYVPAPVVVTAPVVTPAYYPAPVVVGARVVVTPRPRVIVRTPLVGVVIR